MVGYRRLRFHAESGVQRKPFAQLPLVFRIYASVGRAHHRRRGAGGQVELRSPSTSGLDRAERLVRSQPSERQLVRRKTRKRKDSVVVSGGGVRIAIDPETSAETE